MPKVPSISPATGNPTTPSFVHTLDFNFVDNAGRTLVLRGVNLSGASKAPVDHLSYLLEDFWETAEDGGESFVGRPLNLDDGSADVHLARLRGWGFNFLRLPFTWEALEHEGPGKYDYEFMDYLIRVIAKCRDYGFRIYMDPHQDTWSRFSGGSGAPYWTLPACGINPRNITATQAAILHCEYPLAHQPDPASLPAMIWSTNYGRLLSQTVFTLFFAGRDFAPECTIDGVNIQDYLQNHYIEAVGQLADRIRAYDGGSLFEECIIGWDSMNEPFEGLCEWDDLNANPTKQGSTLKKGTHPTPAQSLRLGMGQPQTVDHWSFGTTGPSRDGSVTIDPKGRKLWADPTTTTTATIGEGSDGIHPKWGWKRDVHRWPLGTCPWAHHGVWDIDTGYILRPDYFKYHPTTGQPVHFLSDYWKPHWIAYARRIRASHPEAIIFVQPPVFAPPPALDEEDMKGRCAYSPHYYDGLTLVTRHWNWFNADALGLIRGKYSSPLQAVKVGEGAIRKSLQQQLGYLKEDARGLGAYPTVIGEIGTPFDMDRKRSYGWTEGGKHKGDYGPQERALDASLNGCDGGNNLNYSIWTYVPDDHTHEWGDGWNMEDLSLFSYDDLVDGDGAYYFDAVVDGEGEEAPVSNQPTQSLPMIAAPSSAGAVKGTSSTLSLAATLGATSLLTPSLRSSKRRPPRSSSRSSYSHPLAEFGWDPNPYRFLTNGARAFRAFVRPCATKVVGQPADMRFDAGKAYFKLAVRVRAEDGCDERGLVRREGQQQQGGGGAKGWGGEVDVLEVREEEQEEGGVGVRLATEVYVPLVHFGHARWVGAPAVVAEGLSRRSSAWSLKDGQDQEEEERGRGRALEALPTTAARRRRADTEATMAVPVPMVPMKGVDMQESFLSSGTAVHRTLPLIGAEGEELLDVEVKVSGGVWKVEGQVIKWWYDVPGEGEGEREYTMEVRRREGVIKVPARRAVGVGGAKSVCEWLCPEEACVIM